MYNLNTTAKLMDTIGLPDPELGDFNLQMFPFNNTEDTKLPVQFNIWQEAFDKVRSMIPLVDGDNTHFITISSKFFGQPGTLRREGLHLDGNFCGDPTFNLNTWGGTSTTWADAKTTLEEGYWVVKKAWVDPFNTIVPIGDYVSDELGGIFLLSSLPGCELFTGEFSGIEVGNGGDLESQRHIILNQTKKPVIQDKDECWFISSNTPHESLEIQSGLRRSFIRVSLNCKYPNKLITKV